jgi:poly(glycerol-phosphate) alpha-glucosyltransferase
MLDKWAIRRSRAKKVLAKFFFEDRLLRSAVCLHALNAEEVESIRDFGLTNPVCVIPNGIMLPPVGPESSPPWKEKFGTEARVLLFLGRLHPKKNVHGLIEAFSQLKSMRKLDDWRLVIAGWDQDGYGKNLDRQVRASGLSDEVVFVGPLYGAEKHAALSNSAAFVLPSFSEGLPMAVLEAWSYGLPVAMSDACNLSEGFRCGAAFQLDTGPKLAEGLYRLLEAPPCLLAEMGERGKRMVTARYSWDAVGAQFGEVYNWALTGGCVPSCVDLYKG